MIQVLTFFKGQIIGLFKLLFISPSTMLKKISPLEVFLQILKLFSIKTPFALFVRVLVLRWNWKYKIFDFSWSFGAKTHHYFLSILKKHSLFIHNEPISDVFHVNCDIAKFKVGNGLRFDDFEFAFLENLKEKFSNCTRKLPFRLTTQLIAIKNTIRVNRILILNDIWTWNFFWRFLCLVKIVRLSGEWIFDWSPLTYLIFEVIW